MKDLHPLKYCIITNTKIPKRFDAVGFYQWLNVFDGQVFSADEIIPLLKDGEFDLIHVRLCQQNIDLISNIRKCIGDNSKTKIVASIDIPVKLLRKEFPKLKKLKGNIESADFVFATEYSISQAIEQLVSKKIYEIQHPADIARIKSLKSAVKGKKITILLDKTNANYKLSCHFFKLFYDLKPQIVIFGSSLKFKKIKKINGIEVVYANGDEELCKILSESEVVLAPAILKNYGKLIVYAAALGCFLIGNFNKDALRRCYPSSTFDSKSLKNFLFQYSWLIKDSELLEFISINAIDKVEYYNWSNMKKKYLDLLFNTTKDSRFNYHFQDKINNPDIIDFFENISHTHGKKHVIYDKNEFVVVCLVKNGIEYLDSFLKHYRQLGAKHFFFIDNNSDDCTVSYLSEFDDVTVYSTYLQHKKYECEIRRVIIEEHCQGRWCLNVDIDEFFDFPHSDLISMDGLLKYLDKNNYTSLVAYMLDMFARETTFAPYALNENLLEKYCYYDISHLHKNKYFTHFKPLCNYNSLGNHGMKYYYGGIRDKHFKTNSSRYLLIKHPLIFIDGKLEPVTNPHYCNKSHVADISGVLRHYKFITSFKDKVKVLCKDLVYYAQKEYEAYSRVINESESLSLFSENAKKFNHVNELLECEFIQASNQYLNYFNIKHKKSLMSVNLKKWFSNKAVFDTEIKPYDIMLYWYITDTCNFSCPECAGNAKRLKEKYAPEVIKIKELRHFLKGFDRKIRISFTGVEPFLVKNIIKIFSVITKKHYISLVTNLVSPNIKEFARKINPDRVEIIVASAHMLELKNRNLLDTFLSNCQLLMRKGFKIKVTEVGYPFIADKADEYRKVFQEIGLDLTFNCFRGIWQKRQYPDAYTEAEMNVFKLNDSLETSPETFNQKGNLCNAGYNIAVIMNNLEIQPCFGIEKNIGSISAGIKLSKNLIRCPVEKCGCPYVAFESVLYKKAMDSAQVEEKELIAIN